MCGEAKVKGREDREPGWLSGSPSSDTGGNLEPGESSEAQRPQSLRALRTD